MRDVRARIPEDLYEQLKKLAERKNTTMQAIITRALERYLREHKPKLEDKPVFESKRIKVY